MKRTKTQFEIEFYTLVQAEWTAEEEDAWDAYAERVETGQIELRFPA